MKVIDLLNKIVNDEEVPKKIHYLMYDYEYEDDWRFYYRKNYDNVFFSLFDDYNVINSLNDEVEIIEENRKEPQEHKIPEKLDTWFSMENVQNNGMSKEDFIIKYANYNFETYFNKINEILDYLEVNKDE